MPDATCRTCPFGEFKKRTWLLKERVWCHCWAESRSPADWCSDHPLRQRDWLAALAMQGLATMETVCGDIQTPEAIARDAYAIADAMLAEAAKKG